jgi:serine/threonine-protein kinase RsbT
MVRKLVTGLKFSLVDQTKMITAASELARNTVVYGGGGDMLWELPDDRHQARPALRFKDQGPGIADLGLALKDGWTSARAWAWGFPAASGWSMISTSTPPWALALVSR